MTDTDLAERLRLTALIAEDGALMDEAADMLERLLGACKDKAELLKHAYVEIERLAAENKVIPKMNEPEFVEMKRRLDANINWPRYLPVQLVGPTAISGWTVRLPSGREIGLTNDEWNTAPATGKRDD